MQVLLLLHIFLQLFPAMQLLIVASLCTLTNFGAALYLCSMSL